MTTILQEPGSIRFLTSITSVENPGCSKIVRSSHPQKAPRRRSSATPHKAAFEDGGEMPVFQQPANPLFAGNPPEATGYARRRGSKCIDSPNCCHQGGCDCGFRPDDAR